MKIVINGCYGGFGLSQDASAKLGLGQYDGVPRDSPELVALVESMGTLVNGPYADLRVIEIPDGVEWEIEEYDGIEWVAETHRTWR